ncbi:MAG: glutathione S-transferase N-terminal domain-containing protein, partial [Alphaproteobacteria bacterium]
MYKLYEFPTSGNCYKVRLALAHVGKAYDRIEISRAGGTKKPEYLKVNPQGKVPALELAPS